LMSINNRHPSQAADCRHMRVPPQPTEPASEAILASTMQPDRDNHEPASLTRFVLQVHLAFSTLLSSQETSAHRPGNFHSRFGATFEPYHLARPGPNPILRILPLSHPSCRRTSMAALFRRTWPTC
jgi:hypothetical protein